MQIESPIESQIDFSKLRDSDNREKILNMIQSLDEASINLGAALLGCEFVYFEGFFTAGGEWGEEIGWNSMYWQDVLESLRNGNILSQYRCFQSSDADGFQTWITETGYCSVDEMTEALDNENYAYPTDFRIVVSNDSAFRNKLVFSFSSDDTEKYKRYFSEPRLILTL